MLNKRVAVLKKEVVHRKYRKTMITSIVLFKNITLKLYSTLRKAWHFIICFYTYG